MGFDCGCGRGVGVVGGGVGVMVVMAIFVPPASHECRPWWRHGRHRRRNSPPGGQGGQGTGGRRPGEEAITLDLITLQ